VSDYLEMTPGEIYDLVACYAVFTGNAREVSQKKHYTYDEALEALKV
jgi:hypothetical protein